MAEQTAGPLLGEREMANITRTAVVEKLRKTAWAAEFKQQFGAEVFERPEQAFEALTMALAQYQLEDNSFHPYDSKYDAYLRGQTTLTASEARGLKFFNDEKKGNCAACHSSEKDSEGRHPLFTDFSYDNLGAPRNANLKVNQDTKHYDLGLCGRVGFEAQSEWCGAFRVPTLRNVALRKRYFHNGQFASLKEVVQFYVQRDTSPEKWYPTDKSGKIEVYNDLPMKLRGAVNTDEAPYDRKRGEKPALSDKEVDDLVAFLNTLTDGWKK